MFNEDGIYEGTRYTVWYNGYLFYGDNDDFNSHDYDKWEDVSGLMNAYPEVIHVRDNYYGVDWEKGEWY